jgi:hypothetical protein
MEDDMKTPEQLSLDLSPPATPAPKEAIALSMVVSLEQARAQKANRELRSVYQSILETVEHLRPRSENRN